MNRDDLTVDMFRSAGRMLQRGIPVQPPELPRSKWSLTILKLEARRDPLVRRACQAALDQAEKRRQLQPQSIRHDCGEILAVR